MMTTTTAQRLKQLRDLEQQRDATAAQVQRNIDARAEEKRAAEQALREKSAALATAEAAWMALDSDDREIERLKAEILDGGDPRIAATIKDVRARQVKARQGAAAAPFQYGTRMMSSTTVYAILEFDAAAEAAIARLRSVDMAALSGDALQAKIDGLLGGLPAITNDIVTWAQRVGGADHVCCIRHDERTDRFHVRHVVDNEVTERAERPTLQAAVAWCDAVQLREQHTGEERRELALRAEREKANPSTIPVTIGAHARL